jgi:hypothetical protein
LLGGGARLVEVPRFDDPRGMLVPVEFDALPFTPQRAFVVGDVPVGTIRGRHALGTQRQLLMCLAGRIEITVRRDDVEASVVLDQPQTGLLLEAGVWISLRFALDGSMLLVLASGAYDPSEYVQEDGDRLG